MTTNPVPVAGWELLDADWRYARREWLGASDVAAVLGFSTYRTPWQVWAEKVDGRYDIVPRLPAEPETPQQRLGIELEPWLLDQAGRRLKRHATRTPHRTYAHPEHPWRTCSPDGELTDSLLKRELVECKTGGLFNTFRGPAGWDDGRVPLVYEVTGRWQMHVMDADTVWFSALVAGHGHVLRRVDRNEQVEADLVAQVDAWWTQHVVGGKEPALGPGDLDALLRMYPQPTEDEIDLAGTDAAALIDTYLEAHARESEAKAVKTEAGAGLKSLLRKHAVGLLGDVPAVTFKASAGPVDWTRYVDDVAKLAADAGLQMPDPDLYRKPQRRLDVKGTRTR